MRNYAFALLVAVFAALMGSFAPVSAEADGDACHLNAPIRVLNAVTGRYETLRTRTDRGWCHRANTIEDFNSFEAYEGTPDGVGSPDSDGDGSPDGGDSPDGPDSNGDGSPDSGSASK